MCWYDCWCYQPKNVWSYFNPFILIGSQANSVLNVSICIWNLLVWETPSVHNAQVCNSNAIMDEGKRKDHLYTYIPPADCHFETTLWQNKYHISISICPPYHGSQLHTCSQFSTYIDSSSIRRNLIMISIFFVPKEKLDSLLDYLRKLYHMIMWVRSYHAIKFFKTHIKIAIANEGFLCRWCVLCT